NFFNAKPAPIALFRFNDFGANLAGPVRRDRTFFFLNYEGSRQRIDAVASGTVPSKVLREQILSTSPALRPILAMMPFGVSQTSDVLVDFYTTARTLEVREDTGSIRIDHRFSQSNSGYARINMNDSRVFGPLFTVVDGAFGLFDRQNVPIRTTNMALSDQHLFGAGVVNEFTAGMQRWASLSDTNASMQPLVFVS